MLIEDLDGSRLEREISKALDRRKLEFYTPYPKQKEFHRLGGVPGITDRLLIAANQVGKTYSAAAEVAMHTTGLYPAWWDGYKFNHETDWWASGTTSQTTRDGPQRLLLGKGELNWGTGLLPGRMIKVIKKATHGVAEAVEMIVVENQITKKDSPIIFKTYDQGRIRWQSETLNGIWYDEEPPEDIYSEGKTRLQVRNGISIMTFTPLLGMTAVVVRFLKEKPPGSVYVNMTIDDAEHYTSEQKRVIIANYLPHEKDARSKGIPVMGSGRVFPLDDTQVMEVPIMIPAHWPRIAGMDIGWDHPTAITWMAWDRDADVIHIYDTHKLREATPIIHAAAIVGRGNWIPVAWPHDGYQKDKGSGKVIAQQYRDLGCKMLKEHATHAPDRGKKEGTGGYSLEAGIMEMLTRMQTGRLKVAQHLNDWLEEFRMYYRKEGLIVKEGDDLMSSTRHGVMMLRHATVKQAPVSGPEHAPFLQTDRGMGTLG